MGCSFCKKNNCECEDDLPQKKFEVNQVWLDGKHERIHIIAIDIPGAYPVVGYREKNPSLISTYTRDGTFNKQMGSSSLNLVSLYTPPKTKEI